MKFNPVIVIPARLAATRLPDKPLADIHGRPMIVHVSARATAAKAGDVWIAAGDQPIVDAVEAGGMNAVLTDPALPSGSDRVHAAIEKIDPQGRYDVVINLQGDFPMIDPASIGRVLEPLADPAVDIGTLAVATEDEEERANPNVVKAVISFEPGKTIGRALYFTRAPAPAGDGPVYHHIGIYAYRRKALQRFVALPQSPLERREKLEQLRALEAGMRIDVALVDTPIFGVDTPADLERARALLAPR
jgi:3-deoxy-manno-octulosonate cytidylyltransferase (CMP-KDO synthetase)